MASREVENLEPGTSDAAATRPDCEDNGVKQRLAPRRSVTFSEAPDTREHSRDRTAPQIMAGDSYDSSADETTAIVRRAADGNRSYDTSVTAVTGAGASTEGRKAKDAAMLGSKSSGMSSGLRGLGARKRKTTRGENHTQGEDQENSDGWWKRTVEKYGSIELENKGSVARDHLALERTFLAWLRTSLSFASIGIGVTQLFRLNTSVASNDPALVNAHNRLKAVGKPLGATFIGVSVIILFIGFHRYFEGQHYVIRGRFPASRGSVIVVAGITGLLIVTSLAVVLAVGAKSFES